jgi:glyoxylase-like metal-dependent hydrolase (beta-lactamase superfamily II)
MNKFWGETERKRGPLCTSVLIRTEEGLMIVDPSVPAREMPGLLNDRAGVTPEDVRHVFLTHFHGDHRFGLEAFPHATWRMSEPEVACWRERGGPEERKLLDRIEPFPTGETPGSVGEGPLPGFRTIFAPGHTPGLTSLGFRWREKRVVIAGDAAMSEDFFRAREGYPNSTDFSQATQSIDALAREADLIVPGHGNVFFADLPPEPGGMWSGGASTG